MKLRKLKQYVIALAPEEVELIYDALDARNDRLERWEQDLDDREPEDVEARKRIVEDLAANTKLTQDFHPLVVSIREADDPNPDAGIERIADKGRVR